MGDLDYDLSCLLEVPDMNNNFGEGSNPGPEGYSSDDGLGVVPDIDNNYNNKRRRT